MEGIEYTNKSTAQIAEDAKSDVSLHSEGIGDILSGKSGLAAVLFKKIAQHADAKTLASLSRVNTFARDETKELRETSKFQGILVKEYKTSVKALKELDKAKGAVKRIKSLKETGKILPYFSLIFVFAGALILAAGSSVGVRLATIIGGSVLGVGVVSTAGLIFSKYRYHKQRPKLKTLDRKIRTLSFITAHLKPIRNWRSKIVGAKLAK